MHRSTTRLSDDAIAIWRAGVDAVRADCLVREKIRIIGDELVIADDVRWSLDGKGRILVVGAGKAGAGMVAGMHDALGEHWLVCKRVTGLISVPENCLTPARPIELVAGRPAGVNESTEAGVTAADRMLQLVGGASPDDLVLCMISGGGSALLPAPVDGVSLAVKQFLTQQLSARGANIQQLNCVRKQLSRIKGGRLAQACNAGLLVSLIISDVLGDPLDVIASGPTVPDSATPADAVDVLRRFDLLDDPRAAAAVNFLQRPTPPAPPISCRVENVILANNATAVDAAGVMAEQLGFSHAMISATACEESAEQVGEHLADMAITMREQPRPDCLISGGEPTVQLADESIRGKGGRNQQLALAALAKLQNCTSIVLLSGGTDGEDGPTDAAGAMINEDIARRAAELQLGVADYLARNDAYHFFKQTGGLLTTGPTHTNVCDLRVVIVQRDRTNSV